MSNRPARIRQREIESAIRAARKQGLNVVELKIGEAWLRIPLVPDASLSDNVPSSWDQAIADLESRR